MIGRILFAVVFCAISSSVAAQAITICDEQIRVTIPRTFSDANSRMLANETVRLAVVHSETAPKAGQYFLLVLLPDPSHPTDQQCRIISLFPDGVGRDGQGFMYLTLDGMTSDVGPNGALIAKMTAAWWDRGDGGDSMLTIELDLSDGTLNASM